MTSEQIAELDQRWRVAESAGDNTALDALSVEDFRLVGPLGFVLTKPQWLARYGGGGLSTQELDWRDVDVRVIGEVAIAIGIHDQRATFRGRAVDGAFRSTHIYVATADGWRLAGIQLSQIAAPPG